MELEGDRHARPLPRALGDGAGPLPRRVRRRPRARSGRVPSDLRAPPGGDALGRSPPRAGGALDRSCPASSPTWPAPTAGRGTARSLCWVLALALHLPSATDRGSAASSGCCWERPGGSTRVPSSSKHRRRTVTSRPPPASAPVLNRDDGRKLDRRVKYGRSHDCARHCRPRDRRGHRPRPVRAAARGAAAEGDRRGDVPRPPVRPRPRTGCTSPRATAASGCRRKLQRTINETLVGAGAPIAAYRNVIGHGMGAPTIVTHGSDAQKARYLRPLFTGEEVWCQLFSEPGAGSDVAGLATKAVLDGEEWIVNGQKVWTTLAHLAKWGMLVARTDPEAPEAQGHDLLRGRHGRARRRGAPAVPDHRRGRVQRGVLHRRAHPRLRAAERRRRGLARPRSPR